MSRQRTHYVTSADGTTIGGTVHGDGPPLVLLQEWIGDADIDWLAVAAHLTDRFTCHLVSNRGRGLTAGLRPPALSPSPTGMGNSLLESERAARLPAGGRVTLVQPSGGRGASPVETLRLQREAHYSGFLVEALRRTQKAQREVGVTEFDCNVSDCLQSGCRC